AKRRGVNLEINAHVLREFPLPGREEGVESRLGELVRARQGAKGDEGRASALEREIEELVARLYEHASCGGIDCAESHGFAERPPPAPPC
ncbi:MAG: hypothetical protein ACM3U2_09525, partial [Deltaproteobacteria bacterium]